MSESNTRSGYQTKKRIPPGGSWGWLISIGLTIPCSLSVGGMHSFGLIFNDFLTSLGAETSAVTVIMGTLFSAQSFAGLFASTLFRKFSMRSIGTIGAVFYFLGHFLTIFVTSVEMLIATYGILQGIGIGLMVPVGYTSFNNYFVKRRVFAMSVTQAMKGIVITSHPIITNICMNMYGFRGTLAILAALNAHAIFGMLAMHPVEWHMKTVKVSEIELKPLTNENNDKNDNEVSVDVTSNDENEKFTEGHVKNSALNQFTWTGIANERIRIKLERSKSLADPTQLDEFDPLRRRIVSIMSLSDFGADVVMHKSFESLKPSGFWHKVVEFLDLSLMKDMIYLNILLGISFTIFADNTFFPLLPIYLNTLGFSKNAVARIVSVGTGADLVSRISLAVLSFCIEPKARYVFLAGCIATISVRCVFLGIFDHNGMMAIVGLMGFFRTWIHVPVALIFAEHLPPERFAAGYGLFMFLNGNFSFVIGPFFGWIRDVTQSYFLFFNLLSLTTCICVIPWIIEILWFKIYPRKSNN